MVFFLSLYHTYYEIINHYASVVEDYEGSLVKAVHDVGIPIYISGTVEYY